MFSSGSVVKRSGTAVVLICCSSLMQLAGWLSNPKLIGIKVSGCHLAPVISRTRSCEPVNHLDQMTVAHRPSPENAEWPSSTHYREIPLPSFRQAHGPWLGQGVGYGISAVKNACRTTEHARGQRKPGGHTGFGWVRLPGSRCGGGRA
jgi:hypothetical protein